MTGPDKIIGFVSVIGALGVVLAVILGLAGLARADASIVAGSSFAAIAFAQAARAIRRLR